MPQQRLFNQAGINIMAAANNKVFGPPGNPKIAIAIKPAQITRAQVFILKIKPDVFCSLGVGVAGPNTRIGRTDLANFVSGAFN